MIEWNYRDTRKTHGSNIPACRKYRNIMCRYIILVLFCISTVTLAQETDTDRWDNQLFVGNKVSWGKNRWRVTSELQFRVIENLETLDRWFVEVLGSYLQTKHWEFTLPIRYSIRPTLNEFRPGFGALYKMYPGDKIQLNHQVLYQADITSAETQHGLRYALFYNHVINDKFIPNAAVGVFYRWSENFTGIQFYRVGAGLTYVIDKKHTLNFSYFVGIGNEGDIWTYQGIPFIQLVINLGTDYQHLPAKFINF